MEEKKDKVKATYKKGTGPKKILTPIEEYNASKWYVMQILSQEKFSAKMLAEHIEKETGKKISPWIAGKLAHEAIENSPLASKIKLYRAYSAKTPHYRRKLLKEIEAEKEKKIKKKESELKGLEESMGMKF